MKFIKWFIKFMFGFREKYKKREEEYHRRSKRFGTSGELVGIIIYTAVPLLSLWGVIALEWGVLKFFAWLGVLTIFLSPKELMITGIVALRHRVRMKVQNKVEGAAITGLAEAIKGDVTAEEKAELEKEKKEYTARGTAYTYDLVVGILGITMAVVVVIAFSTVSIIAIRNAILALK